MNGQTPFLRTFLERTWEIQILSIRNLKDQYLLFMKKIRDFFFINESFFKIIDRPPDWAKQPASGDDPSEGRRE